MLQELGRRTPERETSERRSPPRHGVVRRAAVRTVGDRGPEGSSGSSLPVPGTWYVSGTGYSQWQSSGFLFPLRRRQLEQWRRPVHHARLRDLHLDHVLAGRQIEHHVRQQLLEDRAQAAGSRAALQRLAGDRAERRGLEGELHLLEVEQLRVLLRERVLRLLEDPHQRLLVEPLEGHRDREAAHQLGDQPEAEQVVRLYLREGVLRQLGGANRVSLDLREADLPTSRARLDDLLQPVERPAADEQDVLRVDLDVLLLRVLPAALRRDARHRAFEDLEQGLLHPLAADVARDARILRLPRDLVDLVDVDDAPLALGDVEVAGLEEADEDVLHVLADVARLGQRRRVGDREGDVEDPRERLREQRLAHTGRADEQDVRLVELDVILSN